MTSTPNKNPTPKRPSPWNEFRRYACEQGHWKDDWWVWVGSAAIAALLTVLVPTGQAVNLYQFLTFHMVMMGFGATVFGFTILGGKDDFFEPLMERDPKGVIALRDMVLYLFCPLVVHGVASSLLIARALFPATGRWPVSMYAFRAGYGFFAIYATYLSYSAFRFLFVLANKRLIWLNGRIRKREQGQCPECGVRSTKKCSTCGRELNSKIAGPEGNEGN
jgi:DNA-directed RNA polymerase subunit RPC12/RpoP